ncbi:MAG: RecX family transcriptional regulator [Anaerolineaceae bacterium]|nr:RecX family transcriptional regulator [Anaerolineaceae bacterium]
MEQTITALKAQKRNPERINVYLDGEFAFGLARIVAAWLHIGQVLSEERIERLRQEDALEAAYQRALLALSYRPRSEQEVQRKLTEAGYDEAVRQAVIERLRNGGLVGDEQFAQAWVENRQAFRPRSKRMLAAELRQKGVGNEEIEQALLGAVDDETMAYEAGARYARKLTAVDWETFRKRLSGYLGRKGFGYETVSVAVRRIWQELREGSEEI